MADLSSVISNYISKFEEKNNKIVIECEGRPEGENYYHIATIYRLCKNRYKVTNLAGDNSMVVNKKSLKKWLKNTFTIEYENCISFKFQCGLYCEFIFTDETEEDFIEEFQDVLKKFLKFQKGCFV